ncbi:MAG: tetratricopeptide repeat protein [Pirellulales bacterium]|jgi:tetratricopeptide (TPR) repeat protein
MLCNLYYYGRYACSSLILCLPLLAAAQNESDLVIVWDANRANQLKVSGHIIEYTNVDLSIKLPSGRVRQIESDRIVTMVTAWRSEYQEAEDLFYEKQYVRAEKGFRRAYTVETRDWIKERIQARILWCLRAQGKWSAAARFYAEVLRKTNPATPYIDVIPIVWHTLILSPAMQGQAAELLDSSDLNDRLIGASWLLASPLRARAVSALTQLELNTNKRIAILATAQLWRTKLPVALNADLEKWQNVINRLPLADQAGPYYVLGKLQQQQGESELAVLSWMRVIILHPHGHQLNAESLLAAIKALREIEKPTQAITLCRELQNEYQTTIAATQTGRLVKQLQKLQLDLKAASAK